MRQFNIQKYADGGLFIGRNYYKSSLIPPSGPVQQAEPTQERPQALSETIKTKLMQNGLTNEVYDFYKDVEAFESTSNFSPTGFDKKAYYKLQAKATELYNNFKQMEEAEKRILKIEAIEEDKTLMTCATCGGTDYADYISMCSKCGKETCGNCATAHEGLNYCSKCWEEM